MLEVQPVVVETENDKESITLGRQTEQGESITDGATLAAAWCRVLGSKQGEESIHARRQW